MTAKAREPLQHCRISEQKTATARSITLYWSKGRILTAPADFHFARKHATTLAGERAGDGSSDPITTAEGSAFEV
jgi:hypothetical protein